MLRLILAPARRSVALWVLAFGLGGCLDHTIETSVSADGSGTRTERLEFTRNADFDLPEAHIRSLTGTASGWRASTRLDADGDTVWVLERTTNVPDLAEWASRVHRPLIRGTTPDRSDVRLGYVRVGDVVFRNSVQVAVSRRSDGSTLVSYREAFMWDHAVDAIVEFLVRDLDTALERAYPRLSSGERGSVLGYVRARVRVAAEEGLFSDEGDRVEAAIEGAVTHASEHAVKVVRVRYPETDADDLRAVIGAVLELDDDRAERLFEETLPGLNLGFNTAMAYRLTLPGRVNATNAHERDGTTLEWRFSPVDDLTGTIVVFAESVVGG